MYSPRLLSHGLALCATLSLLACSGGGSKNPATTNPLDPGSPEGALPSTNKLPANVTTADLPDPADFPVAIGPEGQTIGALAYMDVAISPDLNLEVAFPRSATAQGDQSRLSGRPYLRPSDVEWSSVRRDVVDGQDVVIVTASFHHPFPAPPDLDPPGSVGKRVDLHVFKPMAVLLMEGSDAFTIGVDSLSTNGRRLLNASGYFKPGAMLVVPNGVTATVFPFMHITPLTDATNYNPTAGGWTSSALLAPTGYGVWAQGSTHTVDFVLQVDPGDSVAFKMAVLAEYQQPKQAGTPKPWLPDPDDPAALRYILPSGAGDNSEVSIGFLDPAENTLPTDPSESITMRASLVDWDNSSAVAASFPNDADLSEGPEASGTETSAAIIPGVTSGVVVGTPVGGLGTPGAPRQFDFTLSNDLDNRTAGTYLGLVRIEDSQGGINVTDLSEVQVGQFDYDPGAIIDPDVPTVVYQVFSVVLENRACDQVNFTLEDQDASATLNNGDQVRFVASRSSASVPALGWTLDVALSGALTEDPPAYTAVDLTTPFTSDLSGGTLQNPTRGDITLTLDTAIGRPPGAVVDCTPVVATVAANEPPRCPPGPQLTDAADGPLNAGDLVRVHFGGISDADNALADLTVTASFDLDGDGIDDETKNVPASDGNVTSDGRAASDVTVRVNLAIADNAGSIGCGPLTTTVGSVCNLYGAEVLNQDDQTTLHNGDRIKVSYGPTMGGSWAFDAAEFSGNLTEPIDFEEVTTTGVTPVTTLLAAPFVVNATRVPVTAAFSISVVARRNNIAATCFPLTAPIAANAEPSCPSTTSLTNQTGGPLVDGDNARITFGGIIDTDDPLADLVVAAEFDLDGDGSNDETKIGTGASTFLQSTGTVIATDTVRVQLRIADSAGEISTPCNPVTGTVGGCNALRLAPVSGLTLKTLTTGNVPRGGTTPGAQPVTGVRLDWGELSAAGAYGVWRAEWPSGTTASSLTFVPLGETPTGTLSFDDTTVDASGARYIFAVTARCLPGGDDGPRSGYGVVALQDFEGVAEVPLLLNRPANTLPNGWELNYSSESEAIIGVHSLFPISGSRSFGVRSLAASPAQNWATFGGPELGDLLTVQPELRVSRLEFDQRVGGDYDRGGLVLATGAARPENEQPTPSGAAEFLWNGPLFDGVGYDTESASVLELLYPGVAASRPVSGPWLYGVATPDTTFAAFDLGQGTLGSQNPYAFFALGGAQLGTLNHQLDDIAWILY